MQQADVEAHISPGSVEKPVGKASKSDGSQLLVRRRLLVKQGQCQSFIPTQTHGHITLKMTRLDSYSVSPNFKWESETVNAWHILDA